MSTFYAPEVRQTGPVPPSPSSAQLLLERIEKLERKVENAETEIQFLRNMVLALEARINGATIAFNGPSKTGSRF